MTDEEIETKRSEILDKIDEATLLFHSGKPEGMMPEEAIQFLRILSSELAERVEVLREENDL